MWVLNIKKCSVVVGLKVGMFLHVSEFPIRRDIPA